MKARTIILFGGSFDPVHQGHITMAKAAKAAVLADEVIFILAKKPRWKAPSAPVEMRLDMLRLAVQKVNGFAISLFEVDSEAPVNYTIDTVRHFREVNPDATLYYLIGFDQVAQFPEWKDADELSRTAHLLAYGRPGYPLDPAIVTRYQIQVIAGKSYDIASTGIRALQNVDTPEDVLDYILDHDLYFMKKIKTYIEGPRLAHSVSVAKLAARIAEANGLPKDQAFIAGLLHDIGKEDAGAVVPASMKRYVAHPETLPPFAVHEFVGAEIAEQAFGITDPAILDAIRYHATGKAEMTRLGKIIYASDKIEPTRGFDSSALIASCLKDDQQGFLDVLKANRDFLVSKNKDIRNPLTDACIKMYLGEHA